VLNPLPIPQAPFIKIIGIIGKYEMGSICCPSSMKYLSSSDLLIILFVIGLRDVKIYLGAECTLFLQLPN